jgi:hypothetical protein
MAEGPCHLAQKHRAAVTQLWVPMAELMTRISLSDWICAVWYLVSSHEFSPICTKRDAQFFG